MQTVTHTFQIGEDVSYGFNGDSYYAGKITKMTKTTIQTERGMVFTKRVRNLWTQIGEYDWKDVPTEVFQSKGSGTWTLKHGIHEYMNPHF